MKIICFYNNFPHQKQVFPLENKPLFYLKPDTSILTHNRPFFIPEFTDNLHCQVELVIRIDKLGKYIQTNYVSTYFHEIALGINIFDKSLQTQCIQNGLAWEKSTAFENSAAMSLFFPLDNIHSLEEITLGISKNQQENIHANLQSMVFPLETLISYVSSYFTLKTGDLLFLGSPLPSIPIQINDLIEAYLNHEKRMRFRIK
ncbi:MAG: fumarylacetoacetate hydrolase family protein [Bacteroidales bacterium]|jgi:2-keto-4-pentenoate hydratase/2-oxohepta-3-ene-1,7-dioic acid hydratase in catechol pathway|nr:fumarylacetoacetate hydrolase family protein [Bacteroidales bacterium]MDD2688193.1 fumarylacetoacetate hydrolase family protein [Bacteroidales bacterium]MDD3329897.1 fumarylacetoacetate hydrolase family protein [Bacteroidales bacterium]MDD3691144.1 fumarylacetoacetate hydrolase family protein [Bacteroidales bacterium]MDD4044195.1 fumarylacetoacetate hydrolase family protein [Bacteroidales bacterium]